MKTFFLSYYNALLQVIVTTFSVFSALSSLVPPLRFLKKYLDHILVTTVFPASVVFPNNFLRNFPQVTCILFWGLYFIEPELVMPAWIRDLIPSWLNHVTHTLPIIYVLFETVVEERNGVSTNGRLLVSFLLVAFYFKV